MHKRKGIAFYGKAASLLLGVLGLLCFMLSNFTSPANRMASFAALSGLSLLGILFAFAALFLGAKGEKQEILGSLAMILAVILYTVVLGRQINGRVLLISGLFTWNSMNMEGWRVFYFMCASAGCFLLADLLLIVTGFFAAEEFS